LFQSFVNVALGWSYSFQQSSAKTKCKAKREGHGISEELCGGERGDSLVRFSIFHPQPHFLTKRV